MCKSNALISPKLQFQLKSLTQITNKEVFQIVYTNIDLWDKNLWLIDIWIPVLF